MGFPIDEVGYTVNYNIPLAWIGQPNWYQLYYDAMDIIDTEMKTNANAISVNTSDIASLSGSLSSHKTQHQAGGSDEISLSGLSGVNITLDQLLVDQILEKTADAGVTVDGVLIKDQRLTNLLDPVNDSDAVTLGYLNSVVQGLDPQESVIDQRDFLSNEPTTRNVGDRYIHNGFNGASSDTGQLVVQDHIYEWNGTDWTDIPAQDGMYVFVEAEEKFYFYDADFPGWRLLGSIISHNNLSGKQGGTADEYYHLDFTKYSFVGSGEEIGFSHNDQLRDIQGGTGAQRYHLSLSAYNDVVDWSDNGIDHQTTLINQQGGTTDEYYHFTSAEHTELSSWLANVTLDADGSINTNGDIALKNDKKLYFGDAKTHHIQFYSFVDPKMRVTGGMDFVNGIYTGNIFERSAGTGINADGVLLKDGGVISTGNVRSSANYTYDCGSISQKWNGIYGKIFGMGSGAYYSAFQLHNGDISPPYDDTIYMLESGHKVIDGWFSNDSIYGWLNELATGKADVGGAHINYFNSATGTITTTSATDVLMTGMSLTIAEAGTYLISFGATLTHTSNGANIYYSIYVNGVQQTNSEQRYQRDLHDIYIPCGIASYRVTVGASQTVEIRWRTSIATASATDGRHISAIKIG